MKNRQKITSIDEIPKRFHPLVRKIGMANALIAIAELTPRPHPKFHWVEKITDPEHFPEGIFRRMAHLIGVENTLTIMHEFEGETIYMRRIREAFVDLWHGLVRDKYRKHNIVELAHQYEISVPTVRQIVNDDERQAELFP